MRTEAVDRSFSVTSEDLISSFFKAGSMQIPHLASENDFADLMKRIPSGANLTAAMAAPGTESAFAAAAQAMPAEGGAGNPAAMGTSRAASIDFIRAYLTKRTASAAPDALNKAVDGTTGLKEEPATDGSGPLPLLSPLGPVVTLPGGGMPLPAMGPAAMLPYLTAINAMNAAALMHSQQLACGPVVCLPPVSVPTSAMGGPTGIEAQKSGASSDGTGTAAVTPTVAAQTVPRAGRRGGGRGRTATAIQAPAGPPDERVVARKERRMLSNRESARRSRKRKQEHVAEMEEQVAALMAERGAMAARMAALAVENEALRAQLGGIPAKRARATTSEASDSE